MGGGLVRWARAAVGAAVLALAPLPGDTASAADPYDLHVIIPLTGGGAFLGLAEKESLEAGVKVINREGGIHGRPLRAVFHDDQTSPQVAVQLLSGFLPENPTVILGSTISAICNAMAPLIQRNGPVLYCFSPSVTPIVGGYEFTAQISSHDQEAALLTYFQAKGWKRVALITTTDASGQDAERNITGVLKTPKFADMSLVENSHFNFSDVTVSAQIERIRGAQPDVVVSWATTTAGGTVFRGMAQAGLELPMAASGSNMAYQQMVQYASFLPKQLYFGVGLWAAHGDARIGLADAAREQQRIYFEAAKEAGFVPDSATELGWEPLRVVADALNHLPEGVKATELRDFLIHWHDHVGLDGAYDFEKTPQRGLTLDNAIVVRWNAEAKRWDLVSRQTGVPLAP